jgi:hypothetical protein
MTHNRAPAVGSGGPTDEKPSKPSGFWRIWKELPPLIQALTPLIILLVGGAGGVAIGHATTPTPQPTATVTVTATAPPPTSAPISTPAPTGTALSVYSQGQVGITSNGLNFDTQTPSSTPSGDIVYTAGGLYTHGDANIEFAVWPNSSTPKATQCQTYVTTHPSPSLLSINPGMQVCIKTDQGRFGLLSIGQVDSNNGVASAQATIWEM